MINLKFYAILALVSSLIGGGITSCHYKGELEKAKLSFQNEKLKSAERYQTDFIKQLTIEKRLISANNELTSTLEDKVREIETRNRKDEKDIIARRVAAKPGGTDGRVFIDPGIKAVGPNETSCSKSPTSETGADKTDSGRRLSNEAVEFLLDYAEGAEVMRRDLKSQKEYGDLLESEILKLRKTYEEQSK